MDISYISGTFFFIIAFLNLFFAFIIWFRGKTKITFYLGWVALFSSIYSFTWGGLYLFEGNRVLWSHLTWSGILMLPAFLTFVYYFTGKTKNIKIKIFPWYLVSFVFVFLSLTTSYVINDNLLSEYPYVFSGTAGPLNFLGRIFVILITILSLFILLKEYQKSQEKRKLQIKYLIWGTTIYTLGGGLLSGLIPLFYNKAYGYVLPFSAFFSLFFVIFTFYAIFKKRLFDIKIILVELLTGIIGLILFIQILMSDIFLTKIFNFIFFLLFLFVGYRLIKTTYSEIKEKEEAKRLSKELSELNLTLEDKIKTRTKDLEGRVNELERFYKLTINRETKMIELKKEINKLKNKND